MLDTEDDSNRLTELERYQAKYGGGLTELGRCKTKNR